jgi:hypothetical protein
VPRDYAAASAGNRGRQRRCRLGALAELYRDAGRRSAIRQR